jgi:manganese transport protein
MSSNNFLSSFDTIYIDPSLKTKTKILKFLGPGLLIAVGYMDPGNWATDLAGGSQFGYLLVSVVLISSLIGIYFQYLAIKLGVVTQKDLAQNCKEFFSPTTSFILWILCEIAIIACDIAEVIGTAIALNLLFNIPILLGAILTIFDVIFVLFFIKRNFKALEVIILSFILFISFSFLFNVIISHTRYMELFKSLVPSSQIIVNKESLYIAIGIIGATIMPHNLYLHSNIVNIKSLGSLSLENKKSLIRYSNIGSAISLIFAFFINAGILILAANAFFYTGQGLVDDISKAYYLLSPILGIHITGPLFAIALLAAGQNSSLTGTLAGQIVMEGFINIRVSPIFRKILTRLVAIMPVIFFISIYGEKNVSKLLILSQVILSFQLPFAIVPLIMFTNSPKLMGEFKNLFFTRIAAFILAVLLISLNVILLKDL